MQINSLTIAGGLSFSAALIHIAIILGGADWYRFFGAGEGMAQMAESGSFQPTVITLMIALVLAVFAVYAWSGAGVLPKLPLLKFVLVVITGIYLLRGSVGLLAPFLSAHPMITQNSLSFWIWSSLICLGFGLVHLRGLVCQWGLVSR